METPLHITDEFKINNDCLNWEGCRLEIWVVDENIDVMSW